MFLTFTFAIATSLTTLNMTAKEFEKWLLQLGREGCMPSKIGYDDSTETTDIVGPLMNICHKQSEHLYLYRYQVLKTISYAIGLLFLSAPLIAVSQGRPRPNLVDLSIPEAMAAGLEVNYSPMGPTHVLELRVAQFNLCVVEDATVIVKDADGVILANLMLKAFPTDRYPIILNPDYFQWSQATLRCTPGASSNGVSAYILPLGSYTSTR